MNNELRAAAEAAAAKAAFPVTVAAASVGGWGMAEWMYTATIIYVVMQAVYLAWKARNEYRDRREFRKSLKLPPE